MKKKFLKVLITIPTVCMFLAGCTNNNNPPVEDDTPAQKDDDTPKEEEKEEEEPTEPAAKSIEVDTTYPTKIEYLEEDGFQIHYLRTTGTYVGWGLWLWGDGKDGGEFEFNYQDEYGLIAYYPVSRLSDGESQVGFIVKKLFSEVGEGNWEKDKYGDDRFIDFKGLKKDEHGVYHLYITEGDGKIYTNVARTKIMDGVSKCVFETTTKIGITGINPMKSVKIYENGSLLKESKLLKPSKSATVKIEDNPVDVTSHYTAEIEFESGNIIVTNVGIHRLYTSSWDTNHSYDGELGAIYAQDKTTFKVWSPSAKSITLKIYDTGTPASLGGTDTPIHSVPMVEGEREVFEATVTGDLEGKYYTLEVKNGYHPDGIEVVDPYARSTGINGLRGMVVDFAKTNPEHWDEVDYLPYDKKSLVVYETHVADVTSSDSWNGTAANAKKFAGMYETGTRLAANENVKTGFDHIKELGVNAVQLIPIFDQANDETNVKFNWGYNPLNYNALEGAYSSDAYDGYARIREFKNLVKAYNDEGIEIIMDVVYNHVNGAINSNFDVLAQNYYFRYDAVSGAAMNGSGCGNETASDHAMFKKFMIDSTKFWATEYKLGGFRFDLMALHDLDTMKDLSTAIHEINPYAAIYGEPWTGGTSGLDGTKQASQSNIAKFDGYGAFNDKFRDALIKGGLSDPTKEAGWAMQTSGTNATANIISGLYGGTGSMTDDPNKAVNYVSCHDNYTLHDRGVRLGITDETRLAKQNLVANAITLAAQGTTFILAGEEFVRTKPDTNAEGGVSGNSYMASYETNQLDYSRKVDYPYHMNMYEMLIKNKTSNPNMRLNSKAEMTDEIYKAETLANGSIIHVMAELPEYGAVELFVSNGTLGEEGYTLAIPENADVLTSNGFLDGEETYTMGKFDVVAMSLKNL